MKIIAVLVTFNRLPLLKKSLQAVLAQKRPPDAVVVINNGSTDGTEAWLAQQEVELYTQKNNGGAGGFAAGINKAYSLGADWLWLMDDDSIPQSDCLEKLEAALVKLAPYRGQVGFLSSTVLWTDDNPHELNKTYVLTEKGAVARFSFAAATGFPLIQWGSFVSLLLSAKAVAKVGLPIREFFIWGDDVEYCKRIIGAGLAGLAVRDSIVVHETPTNHRSNVLSDPQSAIWKYNHGLRNELFTKRLHEGKTKFWVSWAHRMFIMPFRILLTRKSHRWAFVKTVWQTSIAALSFHPAIQKADGLRPVNTALPATGAEENSREINSSR